MPSPWVQRLFHRLSNWLPGRRRHQDATHLAAKGKVRIAVSPPALQPWACGDADMSNWQISHWLDSSHARAIAGADSRAAASPAAAKRRITPIQDIRHEFLAALRDLPAPAGEALEQRIRASRSLRELWHLRPEVFKVLALHRDQRSAQDRLDRLNRHFPSDVLGRTSHHPSIQPLRTAP